MTIDLKWFLPFVVPVALLALFRVMWLLAGAEWDENVAENAAVATTVVGIFVGTVLLGGLSLEAPDALKFRIGDAGKGDEE